MINYVRQIPRLARDTSKATIKLGGVTVESQPHTGVLRIIVDNRMTLDQQINKVITGS